jgi:hypothetical protein
MTADRATAEQGREVVMLQVPVTSDTLDDRRIEFLRDAGDDNEVCEPMRLDLKREPMLPTAVKVSH